MNISQKFNMRTGLVFPMINEVLEEKGLSLPSHSIQWPTYLLTSKLVL